MVFGTDIYDSQGMNPTDVGDPMTLPYSVSNSLTLVV